MMCDYCGNKILKMYHCIGKGPHCFYQCSVCGLISLDKESWPKDLEHYYENEYYKDEYEGGSGSLWVHLPRLRIIDRFLKKRGRLLEIGAGSGEMLHLLQEGGYDAVGIEPSRRAVLLAKEQFAIRLYQGSFRKELFGPKVFDTVCLYQLFEHVPRPEIFLEEVKSVLKKGGQLLIETPNPSSIDAFLSKRLREVILRFPQHLFLYSPRLLSKMLKKHGFEIIALETSVSYLLAEYLGRIKGRKKGHSIEENSLRGTDATYLWERAHSHSFLKDIARNIFPGMQFTIIAKKL